MGETKRATAIRFEGIPRSVAAATVINEIAVEFRTVFDPDRSAVLALPGDAAEIRDRLEKAGFLIIASDAVDLTEEESWFLSDDDLDGVESLGEEDEFIDVLDDIDMGFSVH